MRNEHRTVRGGTLYVLGGLAATGILVGLVTFGFGRHRNVGVGKGDQSANGSACNCNVDATQTGSAGDFKVLSVGSGQSWALSWLSSAGVKTGGTWYSTLDSVSRSGSYAVPTAALPDNLDVVSYLEPSGVDHTFVVFVSGTPEQPLNVPTNYFERADAGSTVTQSERQQFIADEVANPAPSVPDDGLWHEVSNGRSQPTPSPSPVARAVEAAISQTQVAKTTRLASQSPVSYQAPSSVGDPTLSVLTLSGIAAAPAICTKHHPLYPPPTWAGQPSSGGSQYKIGPTKTYVKKDPWQDSGYVDVTASMSATIESVFGLKVSAGAKIDCKLQNWEWKKVYNRDVYNCVNGLWTYCCSQTCFSLGTGAVTKPIWWDYFEGYPSNGTPVSWTPWTCNPL